MQDANFQKLREVIVSKAKLNVTPDEVTLETSLTKDLAIDSIKMLELIIDLEEAFAIRFHDEQLDLDVLGKMTGLVQVMEELGVA